MIDIAHTYYEYTLVDCIYLLVNVWSGKWTTLEDRLHKSDVLSMKNHIYFSVIAAAILCLVFLGLGT